MCCSSIWSLIQTDVGVPRHLDWNHIFWQFLVFQRPMSLVKERTRPTWWLPIVRFRLRQGKQRFLLILNYRQNTMRSIHLLVGGLVAIFYCPIYWEFHHPIWLSHIFQRGGEKPPSSLCLLYIPRAWLVIFPSPGDRDGFQWTAMSLHPFAQGAGPLCSDWRLSVWHVWPSIDRWCSCWFGQDLDGLTYREVAISLKNGFGISKLPSWKDFCTRSIWLNQNNLAPANDI